MIAINNLVLKYGDKIVLNNINKSFESSKVHGIVGLNGAGKTSLFNVIAKVIKVELGEILYNEDKITHNIVSYLETQPFFYSRITGKEYLSLFPNNNSVLQLEEIVKLLQVPLDNLVSTYSTGEQKKIALLGILKQNRPILILDEPFNGLDMQSSKVIESIILRLKERKITIFISSHILNPLFSLCDAIHHLENGSFQATYLQPEFDVLDKSIFNKLKMETYLILQQYL